MSDDESNRSDSESEHEEEEEEEEVKPSKPAPPKKRSEAPSSAGLDDTSKELLELNRQERDKMEEEIEELRKRSEKRKKQREVEEKRLAAERVAEDERRKAAEEAKKKQKSEDEERKQKERALKMAEFEKWKTPQKRNFIITRKETGEDEEEEENPEDERGEKSHKTKEQLEAEKRAILKQRIKPMEIDGLDASKLAEKAKEFHSWLTRLEGERYDLEKRYKSQQAALMDLAERARQVNKVGKGGLKRIGGNEDEVDKIQARFAGAPAKVEMFSKYERQKDKRTYGEKFNIFTGPQFISPPERIRPNKTLQWDGEGMPIYTTSGVAAE